VSGERRIARRFAALKSKGRGGLVTFVTAGDPDYETSEKILAGLPEAGADLIEIGMPFSDPMADGPAIQAANLRALASGITLKRTLDLVRSFRKRDSETPVILMGYYNPIYSMGAEKFSHAAREAGADGVIIVDLPPEEEAELKEPVDRAGLDFVRLTTPTSDDKRLDRILPGASGFIYYVSVAGITGTKSAAQSSIEDAVARLRRKTALPVAVGFGIRTPEQAAEASRTADAAVVGSALVSEITAAEAAGKPRAEAASALLGLTHRLAAAVRAGKP
jgi:tryptophan synthase alpha chain